jgi:hypothetical protein
MCGNKTSERVLDTDTTAAGRTDERGLNWSSSIVWLEKEKKKKKKKRNCRQNA